MTTAKAKVFWSGRSQAVRLPKQFRIAGDVAEVEIHRQGNLLILELPHQETETTDEWAWLDSLEPLDPDVIAATEEDEGPFEDRPERDAFFR
jgi:antitoxin VapB